MLNFVYDTPTRVFFGRDTENEVGKHLAAYGAKKVLLVYGGQSAQKSGLLGRVEGALKEAGVAYERLGGVQPNPVLSLARKGIALAKESGVDFLLAVGGGSVIDTAKAIAYGAVMEADVWEVFEGKVKPQSALPVGCVLTIAAAGSEMSNSAVITNDETQVKRGSNSSWGRPRFAVMNPALTTTLPAYQTAVGVADILMHTMERYFTPEDTMMTTDGIAESLLRSVMENGRILTREPDSYDARAEVMWAGALSHNGLTGAGGGAGDWACHQLGHELSAKYDLAHGASLSVVWGSWARYVYKKNVKRFAQFAAHVMELDAHKDLEALALSGIEEMEEYFWALDLPTSLAEANITMTDEEIEEMATRCTYGGQRTIGAMQVLGQKEIADIYRAARGE